MNRAPPSNSGILRREDLLEEPLELPMPAGTPGPVRRGKTDDIRAPLDVQYNRLRLGISHLNDDSRIAEVYVIDLGRTGGSARALWTPVLTELLERKVF